MSRTNFLQDLLATIFERGADQPAGHDERSLDELCAALLSEQGEASGIRIATAILDHYDAASVEEKEHFFRMLVEDHDVDCEAIAKQAEAYRKTQDFSELSRLLSSTEPPRQEILRRLNRPADATGRLVRMRADLLEFARDDQEFRKADLDFRHLFSSWFNRGFLVLRRIDWTTPANILEKIVAYEAVHAINDWNDLRRRLEPADRRCFAFFHPSMPDEPLIFVEVALTASAPNSIQTLLSNAHDPISENAATTAVFYSISNCQKGLSGISFGNFLIKQVASDLSLPLPNLKNFVTLSPVPGLVHWLRSLIDDADADDHRRDLAKRATEASAEDLEGLRTELASLAAEYLVYAKRPDGRPLDPVARFHLGNGASLDHVHALADTSAKGLAEACGVMVNYRYDLKTVEANHEAYTHKCEVAISRPVRALIGTERAARQARRSANA